MKVLVTGASGFIGSHLTEALIERGHEVTCATRGITSLRWIEHLNVRRLDCDLAKPDSYAGRLADYDYIFHVAGLTKSTCEQDYFFSNAECTRRLSEASAKHCLRLRRFIYVSSLAAVGPSLDGTPLNEDSPPRPVSMYGRSKLEGEKAVLELKEKMPVTVLRPPAVYGPRDSDFYEMFKMIKKGFFPYWGPCFYSLLYVEDLVEGIISAAERDEALGETFFLSDGVVHRNEEIAKEISLALNSKALKIRVPRSFLPSLAFVIQKLNKKGIINEDRVCDFNYSHWICDTAKANRVLGFTARTTLREGIKWTADWYKIHRWL